MSRQDQDNIRRSVLHRAAGMQVVGGDVARVQRAAEERAAKEDAKRVAAEKAIEAKRSAAAADKAKTREKLEQAERERRSALEKATLARVTAEQKRVAERALAAKIAAQKAAETKAVELKAAAQRKAEDERFEREKLKQKIKEDEERAEVERKSIESRRAKEASDLALRREQESRVAAERAATLESRAQEELISRRAVAEKVAAKREEREFEVIRGGDGFFIQYPKDGVVVTVPLRDYPQRGALTSDDLYNDKVRYEPSLTSTVLSPQAVAPVSPTIINSRPVVESDLRSQTPTSVASMAVVDDEIDAFETSLSGVNGDSDDASNNDQEDAKALEEARLAAIEVAAGDEAVAIEAAAVAQEQQRIAEQEALEQVTAREKAEQEAVDAVVAKQEALEQAARDRLAAEAVENQLRLEQEKLAQEIKEKATADAALVAQELQREQSAKEAAEFARQAAIDLQRQEAARIIARAGTRVIENTRQRDADLARRNAQEATDKEAAVKAARDAKVADRVSKNTDNDSDVDAVQFAGFEDDLGFEPLTDEMQQGIEDAAEALRRMNLEGESKLAGDLSMSPPRDDLKISGMTLQSARELAEISGYNIKAGADARDNIMALRSLSKEQIAKAFGIPEGMVIDEDVISRAYKQSAKNLHPDKNIGNELEAADSMTMMSALRDHMLNLERGVGQGSELEDANYIENGNELEDLKPGDDKKILAIEDIAKEKVIEDLETEGESELEEDAEGVKPLFDDIENEDEAKRKAEEAAKKAKDAEEEAKKKAASLDSQTPAPDDQANSGNKRSRKEEEKIVGYSAMQKLQIAVVLALSLFLAAVSFGIGGIIAYSTLMPDHPSKKGKDKDDDDDISKKPKLINKTPQKSNTQSSASALDADPKEAEVNENPAAEAAAIEGEIEEDAKGVKPLFEDIENEDEVKPDAAAVVEEDDAAREAIEVKEALKLSLEDAAKPVAVEDEAAREGKERERKFSADDAVAISPLPDSGQSVEVVDATSSLSAALSSHDTVAVEGDGVAKPVSQIPNMAPLPERDDGRAG